MTHSTQSSDVCESTDVLVPLSTSLLSISVVNGGSVLFACIFTIGFGDKITFFNFMAIVSRGLGKKESQSILSKHRILRFNLVV